MVETPTGEELNRYRVGQAVEEAQENLDKDEDPYLENELDLKSFLIDLKAKKINPLLNVPDLVLGTIKDPVKIKELEWNIEFSIECFEAGLGDSAKLLADKALTILNFRRSEGGSQQQFLITRSLIKGQHLEISKEKSKPFETFKNKIMR